jgi:hypothetical protein
MSISATKVKGSKKVTFFPPKPGGLHMRKPTKRWSATTIQTAHWFAIVFTKTTGKFVECAKCKNIFQFGIQIFKHEFRFEKRCPFCETNPTDVRFTVKAL